MLRRDKRSRYQQLIIRGNSGKALYAARPAASMVVVTAMATSTPSSGRLRVGAMNPSVLPSGADWMN
jgi:hypothetical protein